MEQVPLPATPQTIVSDRDRVIAGAVRRIWPSAAPGAAPFHFWCEYHLSREADLALKAHNANNPQSPWNLARRTAFHSRAEWDHFVALTSKFPKVAAWLQAVGTHLEQQTGRRHQLPAHYSNGAAERALQDVRQLIERRSFVLRNAARTNLLLGLVTRHLNNTDGVTLYHQLLRDHTQCGGAIRAHRVNRDRAGPTLR